MDSSQEDGVSRYRLNEEPFPIDLSVHGDLLGHYLIEELSGVQSDIAPPQATDEFESWLEFKEPAAGELNVVFGTRKTDGHAEDYIKFGKAFIAAATRLFDEEKLREWWAIIGPTSHAPSGGPLFLESDTTIGGMLIRRATSGYTEASLTSEIFPNLDGWTTMTSYPLRVEGASRGFDWQAAAEVATGQLNNLCALISLHLDIHWRVRRFVQPLDASAPKWELPPRMAGIDSAIGISSAAPDAFVLPEWVDTAWQSVESSEQFARSLAAHYQGLGLEREYVSYAVIAYVSAIEGLGALTLPVERCSTCGNIMSAGKRFRDALKPVLSSKARSSLYAIYSNRSETAHQGYLFGGEMLRGSVSYARSLSAAPAHLQFKNEAVAELRDASKKLLVHLLVEGGSHASSFESDAPI